MPTSSQGLGSSWYAAMMADPIEATQQNSIQSSPKARFNAMERRQKFQKQFSRPTAPGRLGAYAKKTWAPMLRDPKATGQPELLTLYPNPKNGRRRPVTLNAIAVGMQPSPYICSRSTAFGTQPSSVLGIGDLIVCFLTDMEREPTNFDSQNCLWYAPFARPKHWGPHSTPPAGL